MWMAEYIEREETCGDCIHADICKDVVGSWFSRKNIAYCKTFKRAADVVPVVRCKDCMHRGDHEVCPLHDIRLCYDGDGHMDEVEDDKAEDEFFCSYGERKEADGNG
jgi:hypothetical protein